MAAKVRLRELVELGLPLAEEPLVRPLPTGKTTFGNEHPLLHVEGIGIDSEYLHKDRENCCYQEYGNA